MDDVDMQFSLGDSINFMFDVGGSATPPSPEPSSGIGYIFGGFEHSFGGAIKSYNRNEILYGAFTEEE